VFLDRKAAEGLKFIEIMYIVCRYIEAQQMVRFSGLTTCDSNIAAYSTVQNVRI